MNVGDYIICLRNPDGCGEEYYLCKINYILPAFIQIALVSAKQQSIFNMSIARNFEVRKPNCLDLTLQSVSSILKRHVINTKYKEELQEILKRRLVDGSLL